MTANYDNMRRTTRARQFNKTTSFASVLDPAFSASVPLLNKGKARSVEEGADYGFDAGRPAISRSVNARKRRNVETRQASALAMVAQEASPQPARAAANSTSPMRCSGEIGNVTEPIEESTLDLTDCQAKGALTRASLAEALALEERHRDKDDAARETRYRNELERRTCYGSVKRAMQRRSVRSFRNQKDLVVIPDDDGDDFDALQERMPGRSDLKLAFSQESHYSIESEDGIYKTQFSFYRFPVNDGEEEGEFGPTQGHGTDGHDQMYLQIAISTGNESSIRHESQGGYEADRSLSTSNQQSLESFVDRVSGVVDEERSSDEAAGDSITIYRPMLGTSTMEENSVEIDDDETRMARTAVKGTLGFGPTPRHVRPTIWRGRKQIDEFFGPLVDAFANSRCPPARADIARWADWMDSQSDKGASDSVKNTFQSSHELPQWSTDDVS